MGDRANCIVHQNWWKSDKPPVWLYTHWSGHQLLGMVQRAIQKRWRWNDPAYLTRIIFDVMTEGRQGEETGFGISTFPQDNEHPYVVVDPREQEVRLEDPSSRAVKQRWSFEAFCAAKLPDPYADAAE